MNGKRTKNEGKRVQALWIIGPYSSALDKKSDKSAVHSIHTVHVVRKEYASSVREIDRRLATNTYSNTYSYTASAKESDEKPDHTEIRRNKDDAISNIAFPKFVRSSQSETAVRHDYEPPEQC
ncbi:hypothetical protein QTP88_008034 [Uroleucon formosanum]